MKNRVIRFDHAGNARVLKVIQETPRQPEVDEVLVRVKASGVNRAETIYREDQYIYPAQFPSRIGMEGVGIVESIGAEVKNFSVGDRVAILSSVHQPFEGTHGDHVTVKATNLIKATQRLSDVEEAATWNSYLTAYGALIHVAGLQQGQTLLITAAASSVGLAAIALAKNVGAQVVATTRKPDKQQALKDAGANSVVVTGSESVAERVLAATNQVGADVIFDPIAGAMAQEFMKALRTGGHYIAYGVFGGMNTDIPMFTAFEKLLTFRVIPIPLSICSLSGN